MELKPPTWYLWKSPFIFSAVILGSFLLTVVRKRTSPIHLLIVLPFIYIGLSGIRFVFLIGLVGGPIFVRNINSFVAAPSPAPLPVGERAWARGKIVNLGLSIGILIITAFT